EHVASLRAEDGMLSLRWAGAQRIVKRVPFPTLRIVVDDDAAPFIREGKNVITKTVQQADPELRPGDDAPIVTSRGELLGIGRLVLSGHELKQVDRGIAARTVERPPN
ncbi:MAG TPA: PUA domain-containing protein, partial [Candidatus Thermoplasmatota archaeon]